jgi:hypothetical protein
MLFNSLIGVDQCAQEVPEKPDLIFIAFDREEKIWTPYY